MPRLPRTPTAARARLVLVALLSAACASPQAEPAPRTSRAPRAAPPPPAPPPDLPTELTLEGLRRGRFAGVLHGAGPMWDPREFAAYQAALPDTPPLIMSLGVNVRQGQRFTWAEMVGRLESGLADNPGLIPLLTIDFVRKTEDGVVTGLDADVAQGRHDRRLTHLAQLVKLDGRPIFVRIAAECNGEWNGYSPATFPAAFRHVVELFRAQGARNAIFVWNVKLVVPDEPPAMAFYPGDDHVDWWSLDLFAEDLRPGKLRDAVMAFLRRAARAGKPVMIPEACPSGLDLDDPATWRRWFEPFFSIVLRDRNVKAFVYSNRDFLANDATLPHWGDMRIDRAALLPEYRDMLRDPRLLHEPAGAALARPDDAERLAPRAPARGGAPP